MKLLNSTVMPNAGTYKITEITPEEFGKQVRSNPIESHIMFESTARIVEQLSGKRVEVVNKKCFFNESQKYLALTLKEGIKGGKNLKVDDFHYYIIEYSNEG